MLIGTAPDAIREKLILHLFQSLIGIHVNWNPCEQLGKSCASWFQSLIGIHVNWNVLSQLPSILINLSFNP